MELEQWEQWARAERGLAPRTIEAYLQVLRSLELDLDEATPHELRAWLVDRAGSPSTFGRRLASLRSYLAWSVRVGRRKDDPSSTIERPRVHAGLPRPVADLGEVLGRLDPTTRAIAIFLAETGLRISEAAAVDVGSEAPAELLVHGKGGRERILPLTDLARTALDELGGRLPLSVRTIQRRLSAVGITPHRLRHTLGTELAASGADLGEIQDLLGHRSPTTSRVYAAYATDRLRAALDRRRGR